MEPASIRSIGAAEDVADALVVEAKAAAPPPLAPPPPAPPPPTPPPPTPPPPPLVVCAMAPTRQESPTKLRMEPPRHAEWPLYQVLPLVPSNRRKSSSATPGNLRVGSCSQTAVGLRNATCGGNGSVSCSRTVAGGGGESPGGAPLFFAKEA